MISPEDREELQRLAAMLPQRNPAPAELREFTCVECGKVFTARRSHALYCSGAHREQASYRRRTPEPDTFTSPGRNPCRWSPEVIDVIATLIRPGEHIHDPFAGEGVRLAALCDRIGAIYTGGDIETWPGRDHRVAWADAFDPASYPTEKFTIVTSPVYVNKRCADYPNGPTPNTKVRGRRDYGIALGRALHPNNLARFTGRPAKAHLYWAGHAQTVKHWGDRVIVNVDMPIAEGWVGLLHDAGYLLEEAIPAFTRRYRGLANAELRADHEVVMAFRR